MTSIEKKTSFRLRTDQKFSKDKKFYFLYFLLFIFTFYLLFFILLVLFFFLLRDRG